ncbi:MAG: HEAT repeat domain-containing protein [Acidobacteriales bacterium]|nr:HEAT repeat domain-containing protein [Terriglobales bacterium]
MNCESVKQNIVFYVYDELADDARYELEQHLERCSACARELNAAREFRSDMGAAPHAQLEPSPNFLAASRMRLQEDLETTEQQQGWLRWAFDPARWLRQIRFAPALATAIFIFGFAGGIVTTFVSRPGPPIVDGLPPSQKASIAGISNIVQEPGSDKVKITYNQLQPAAYEGKLDDPQVQQLLLYATRNQANPAARLDSIDLLGQQSEDSRIREALVFALRYDKNPGVRLKALEGLQAYVKDDTRVRDAIIEALLHDSNSGVRTQAIRMLQEVRADSTVRGAFTHLAQDDKNEFIRREAKRVLGSLPEID